MKSNGMLLLSIVGELDLRVSYVLIQQLCQ